MRYTTPLSYIVLTIAVVFSFGETAMAEQPTVVQQLTPVVSNVTDTVIPGVISTLDPVAPVTETVPIVTPPQTSPPTTPTTPAPQQSASTPNIAPSTPSAAASVPDRFSADTGTQSTAPSQAAVTAGRERGTAQDPIIYETPLNVAMNGMVVPTIIGIAASVLSLGLIVAYLYQRRQLVAEKIRVTFERRR